LCSVAFSNGSHPSRLAGAHIQPRLGFAGSAVKCVFEQVGSEWLDRQSVWSPFAPANLDGCLVAVEFWHLAVHQDGGVSVRATASRAVRPPSTTSALA